MTRTDAIFGGLHIALVLAKELLEGTVVALNRAHGRVHVMLHQTDQPSLDPAAAFAAVVKAHQKAQAGQSAEDQPEMPPEADNPMRESPPWFQ